MIHYLKTASLLTFTAILLFGCSSTRTVSPPQVSQPPEIDGNITGWDLQNTVIEQTDVADYYAKQDDEFLYIYVDIKSAAHNQAMMQSGFIIYLGNSKEDRNRTGIAFPSGTFNLLRENPAVYDSFLNNEEWFRDPQNIERLEELQEDIFDRVMIVERIGSDANYGFIDKEQLQVDGIDIESGENRRLTTIEMRIPLNTSSVYSISGDELWLGFEIDPPNFRIQNNDNTSMANRRQGYGRGGMYQGSNAARMNMRQRMGQYERWYLLELD